MAVKFKNTININDQYTFPTVVGTDGQYLSITDAAAGTLDWTTLGDIDGSKSNFVYYDAKNSTGSTIEAGTAVMAAGTHGNSGHILIAPMVADGSVEPKYFIGVTDDDISNGQLGKVVHFGTIDSVNTNAFSDGDILWCDPNNPGGFTTTEPIAPSPKLAAAIVLNAATNGKLLVRVQGNEGLHELHDVKITSPLNAQVISWNAAEGYWENTAQLGGNGNFSVKTDIFTGNNSTTNFEVSFPIANENNLQVYIDGVYQSKDNYTTSGTTLSFSTAPPSGVSIEAVHIVAVDISPVATNEFVGDGATTTFALSDSLTSENRSMVFIEGVYQEKSTYSITGNDIIFTTAPQDGYSIEVMTLGSIISGGTYIEDIIAGDGISVSRTNADVTITNTITNNNQLTNGAGYALDSDLDAEETARIAGDANLQTQIDNINSDNVDGSGTANYVPKWTDGDTIGNSVIYDDGTNIGIGTSSPSSILSVVGGAIRSKDTDGEIGFDFYQNSSVGLIRMRDNKGIAFYTNNTERMGVTAPGNVYLKDTSNNSAFYWDASTARLGIGTTSPTVSLDVNLNAQFNKLSVDGGFVNILGNNSSINIGADKGGGAVLKYNSNGNLDITPRSGYNTVFTSGNVGIGTSSPDVKFSVNGTIKSTTSDYALPSTGGAISMFQDNNNYATIWAVKDYNQGWADVTLCRLGGNVGIGTTPSSWGSGFLGLDLGGSTAANIGGISRTRLASNLYYDGTNTRYKQSYGGTAYFQDAVNTSHVWYTVPTGTAGATATLTERMRIDSSGLVSITRADSSAQLKLERTVTGTGSMYIGADSIGFKVFDNSFTPRLVVESTGNVGIGTTSPTTSLSVQGATNKGINIIGVATTATRCFIGLNSSNHGYMSVTGSSGQSPSLINSAGGNSYISGGNVGIGTSSPNRKLEIASDSGTVFRITNTANGTLNSLIGSIEYYINDNDGAHVGATINAYSEETFGRSTYLSFATNVIGSAAAERMRITSGGDVLIGTQGMPNGTSVYGSAFGPVSNGKSVLRMATSSTATQNIIYFYNPNGQVGTISTSASSTSYNTGSDYRLKEDWQPMVNALDRVEALKPINFAWKTDGSRVDGFLAHELAEVIPEAVTGEKDATEEYEVTPAVLDEESNVIEEAVMGTRNVYQGIDQSKIVPLLTAALQEANQMIKDLTTRIETLENN